MIYLRPDVFKLGFCVVIGMAARLCVVHMLNYVSQGHSGI